MKTLIDPVPVGMGTLAWRHGERGRTVNLSRADRSHMDYDLVELAVPVGTAGQLVASACEDDAFGASLTAGDEVLLGTGVVYGEVGVEDRPGLFENVGVFPCGDRAQWLSHAALHRVHLQRVYLELRPLQAIEGAV